MLAAPPLVLADRAIMGGGVLATERTETGGGGAARGPDGDAATSTDADAESGARAGDGAPRDGPEAAEPRLRLDCGAGGSAAVASSGVTAAGAGAVPAGPRRGVVAADDADALGAGVVWTAAAVVWLRCGVAAAGVGSGWGTRKAGGTATITSSTGMPTSTSHTTRPLEKPGSHTARASQSSRCGSSASGDTGSTMADLYAEYTCTSSRFHTYRSGAHRGVDCSHSPPPSRHAARMRRRRSRKARSSWRDSFMWYARSATRRATSAAAAPNATPGSRRSVEAARSRVRAPGDELVAKLPNREGSGSGGGAAGTGMVTAADSGMGGCDLMRAACDGRDPVITLRIMGTKVSVGELWNVLAGEGELVDDGGLTATSRALPTLPPPAAVAASLGGAPPAPRRTPAGAGAGGGDRNLRERGMAARSAAAAPNSAAAPAPPGATLSPTATVPRTT